MIRSVMLNKMVVIAANRIKKAMYVDTPYSL